MDEMLRLLMNGKTQICLNDPLVAAMNVPRLPLDSTLNDDDVEDAACEA